MNMIRKIAAVTVGGLAIHTYAATSYFAGDGSALSATKYGTSATGPFTSSFTTNNVFGYGNTNSGTGTGASITVGGFDFTQSFTLTSTSGTITNASNGVVDISVASGKTADFGSQSFTSSSTAGYTKSGAGTVAFSGGTYGGGFTLNAGTVILRGTNALGNGALTLNGGTLASNNSRDLTGKYTSITVGGNVQFGELAANVAVASDSANLTFSNNVALGNATRTFTLGNNGNIALGGVIGNTASTGLTFAANTGAGGRFDVTNASNTFSGTVTINGGEVRFTADGSIGNSNNAIVIDGGRFATLSGASYSLGANRTVSVGNTAGTSISTPGAGTLTINQAIGNKSGVSDGVLVKQGGGTLALGGVSTYGGGTSVNNGTLQLTTGNDRLPTGTTLNLGQAASTNLGAVDLNGFNQQVAGLNSVTGTNASTTLKNTIKSVSAATLTLGGSGDYTYGAGTAANSGVISGAIKLVKTGIGTQTLGDANDYTGGTEIDGGTLALSTNGTIGTKKAVDLGGGTFDVTGKSGGYQVNSLVGSGSIKGALTVTSFAPGHSVGAISFANSLTLTDSSSSAFEVNSDSSYDTATGNAVTFGGTLGVTFDPAATFADNTVLPLFSFSNYSGAFANVSYSGLDPSKYSASFDGTNGQLKITAVPEPVALSAIGLGGLTLLRRRRRSV